MDFGMMIKAIPATFWGIVVGSLFTMIGVVLTNAGNTRRLRLQHEHERALESKERDMNLHREVYFAAIEAISAGMVSVGRFGEVTTPYQDLMVSYNDRAPAIAKVNIVGREETIEAVANFAQELTGTFLRLSSQREQLAILSQQNAAVEEKIAQATQEHDRIQASIEGHKGAGLGEGQQRERLQREFEITQQRIEELRAEQAQIEQTLYPAQMTLIRNCVKETEALDRLLIPVISMMRAELELPFDEAYYSRIIEASHQKLSAYLEAFVDNVTPLFDADSTSG